MNSTLEARPSVTLERGDIRNFYDAYYSALDDLRLEEWPSFFTADCAYSLVPRENHERGFPLATIRAESRGMLEDRVTGLLKAQFFSPRYYRRFPGPLQFEPHERGLRVRHNLLVIQTLIDRQPEIILCGTCRDLVVVDEGRVRIRERTVIFDSEMILNSLIYPI